jgi:peptidoglycan hydrolase-like protein with peptidoglycan-binding domain
MKHSLTAVLAIVSATGLAGIAQAQTTAPPPTAPPADMQQSNANDFWSRPISQDEVRQAQQQLAAQGLYRGPIDGLVNTEMQRALTRFQQQNGLRLTATLDPDTMGRLMMASAGAGQSVGASTPPPGTTAPPGAGDTTYTAPPAQPAPQY